jgi:hypothetical protein
MLEGMADQQPTIHDAVDLLNRAHAIAQQAIQTATTPQQALEWAAAYYTAAERILRAARKVRRQTARTIWLDTEFDIAQEDIGNVLGIGEARVSQLIKEAEGES